MSLRSRVVFGCGLLFAFLVSEANLTSVKRANPYNYQLNGASTVHGLTIWSIDNNWYLPQATNYLEGRGLTLEPSDRRFAVRRTPGYPVFFALHHALFGETGAYRMIRFTQILLFALSATLVASTAHYVTADPRTAWYAGLTHAFCPFLAVYSYYTVTEAVYPALVACALYAYARARRDEATVLDWLFAGGLIGAATLTRPLCGLLLPAAIAAALTRGASRSGIRRGLRDGGLLIAGTAFVLLPWMVRNYTVSGGEVVPLEKVYDEDWMGFGRAHSGFRDWWGSWDNPDAEMYTFSIMVALESGGLTEAAGTSDAFLAQLPPVAFSGGDPSQARTALLALNQCLSEKMATGWRSWAAKREYAAFACDDRVYDMFVDLRRRFARAAPARYWVISPLRNLGRFVFHSHTAAFGTLGISWRSASGAQLALKALFFVFNVVCWLSILVLLARRLPSDWRALTGVFVASTVGYLVLVLRYVEARYALQCYPLLFITLASLATWRSAAGRRHSEIDAP